MPKGAINVVVLTPEEIEVSFAKPALSPKLNPSEKLEEDSLVKVEEELSPGGCLKIKKGISGAVVVKSTETGLFPRTTAHSLIVVCLCSEVSEARTSNFFLYGFAPLADVFGRPGNRGYRSFPYSFNSNCSVSDSTPL